MLDERGRDLANLFDGFTGPKDNFRIATAAAAVEIDGGGQFGTLSCEVAGIIAD